MFNTVILLILARIRIRQVYSLSGAGQPVCKMMRAEHLVCMLIACKTSLRSLNITTKSLQLIACSNRTLYISLKNIYITLTILFTV